MNKLNSNIEKILKETPKLSLAIIISYKDEDILIKGEDIESIFPIASLTKPIVSLAFLELLEEKNISINTKIKDFDINFLNKNFQNLSLKNLLTHRSGIKNSGKLFQNNESLLNDLINSSPISEIGDFSYSNNNYNILRFIIEKITNKSFEKFLNKFLNKLNMLSTGEAVPRPQESQPRPQESQHLRPQASKIPGHLYDLNENLIEIKKYPNNKNNAPSFNLLSTPEDMGNLLKYLSDPPRTDAAPLRLLSPLIMKKTILPSGTTLSFNYENTPDGYFLDHNGLLATGFQSYIRIIPEENLSFCILANDLTVNISKISDIITKSYAKKEYKHKFTLPINSDIHINILNNINLGFYKGYEAGIVELYREDDRLFLNMFEVNYEIKHFDDNKFYFYNDGFLIELIIEFDNTNGKIFVNSDAMIKIKKPKPINKSKIARKLKGVYKHNASTSSATVNILGDIEIFTEYDQENIRIFLYNSKEEFEIYTLDSENELIIPDYGHLILKYDNNGEIIGFEEDGFEEYIKN